MNTRLNYLNRRAKRRDKRYIDITWRHDLPQHIRESFAELDSLYRSLRQCKYPESGECAYRECDELAGRLKHYANL